tara:strand:+ start:4881 stop:7451 length:2571 start_codon:yes stop_codon:yes gene_type:complete
MNFILFLSLFFSFLFTQENDFRYNQPNGKISGLILNDINQKPIEYATISIFSIKSDVKQPIYQRISNKNGYFYIDDIKPGKYKIIIQFPGFEIIEKDNIILKPSNMNIDLGTIKLSIESIELDQISVNEKKNFIENKIDKKVYNVADEASTTGGSASDVLEQIPSISLDIDGNIQLRQDGNVTILVDGRESSFGNNVDMLGADMIDRVEVITTPSAKYDPDGTAGIINIILSKNEYLGVTGNIKPFYGQRNNFGISGSLNFLKNDWNIFTNYSLRNKTSLGPRYRKTLSYDENDNLIDYLSSVSNGQTYRHPQNTNLKLGIETYPSANETIAFDLTFMTNTGVDSARSFTYLYDLDSYVQTRTIEDGYNDDINFGFGYFNNLSENEGWSLQFDFEGNDNYETINNIEPDTSYLNLTDEEGSDKVFMLDYYRPIENNYNSDDSKIEVGMKVKSNNDLKNQNYNDSPFNYDYNYNRLSLYINTSYYFTESFGIQGGLRFESSTTNSLFDTFGLDLNSPANVFEWSLSELGEEILDFEYSYDRIYPSLYFLYDMKEKGDLKFEFGRRINRPGPWNLNPFPSINHQQKWIRQGNPLLKPEDIYKYELNYSNKIPSIGYLSVGLYFSQVTNLIDRHKFAKAYTLLDNEQYCSMSNYTSQVECELNEEEWIDYDVYSILTSINKGKTEDSGFEFTLITKPLSNWKLMISGNYWYNNTTEAENKDMLGVESGFRGKLKSTFKLKNNQEIQLIGNFRTKMKITLGEIAPSQSLDFAYKKEVDDKFNITLKIQDLFDSRGFHIFTNQDVEYDDTISQFMEADIRWKKRTISISFDYKFGDFKKKKYIRGSSGYDYGGSGGMDAGY